MDCTDTRKAQPHRRQPSIRRLQRRTQPLFGTRIDLLQTRHRAQIHPTVEPARHIQRSRLDPLHALVLDLDQATALGSGLARVPPLEIAWKDDPGRLVDDLVPMHMPERPVVIAERAQTIARAGRIGVMIGTPVERGMQ